MTVRRDRERIRTLTAAVTGLSLLTLCATTQAWCDSARGTISPTWKPAQTIGTFTASNAKGAEIGRHESAVMHQIEMSFSTTCKGEHCRTCAHTVNGTAGYAPSVILIRNDARRNRCVEPGSAQPRAAPRRRDTKSRAALHTTSAQHAGMGAPGTPRNRNSQRPENDSRSTATHPRECRGRIDAAMQAAESVAKREDAAIDSERSTKAEWRRMRKRCGQRPSRRTRRREDKHMVDGAATRARTRLTRKRRTGEHGRSIAQAADMHARARLSRPRTPTDAYALLAPTAAPGAPAGVLNAMWNAGCCLTNDGAAAASATLEGAIEAICAKHGSGPTATGEWEQRRERVINAMTQAALGPETEHEKISQVRAEREAPARANPDTDQPVHNHWMNQGDGRTMGTLGTNARRARALRRNRTCALPRTPRIKRLRLRDPRRMDRSRACVQRRRYRP